MEKQTFYSDPQKTLASQSNGYHYLSWENEADESLNLEA